MAAWRHPVRARRETPWLNGLGIAAEIAASDARRRDGAPLWRLSLARMEGPARFSDWSGWRRVLTVVEGAGLALDFRDGRRVLALPLAPVAFPGAPAPRGRPLGRRVANLNLIADPALAVAAGPLRLIAPRTLRAGEGLVFIAAGRAAAGGLRLRRGDVARFRGWLDVAPLGGPARAVFIRLGR